MFKKIAIGAAVLVVVVVLGLGYLWSNLDSLIRSAVEKYGTAATQTAVNLDSVKLSVASGEGSLGGLSVDNPKDFNSGVKAFYLGSIEVKVDVNSIKGDGPIIIREVTIEKPQVNYEITTEGNSNLSALQKNATAYADSMGGGSVGQASSKQASSTDKSGGRKIIIDNLYVRDGQIGISAALLKGKNLTAPLPEIHLSNIGKNSGGTTAAEVAQQLISSITASAGSAAMSAISSNLGGLTDFKVLQGVTSDSTANVRNQIKHIFGN